MPVEMPHNVAKPAQAEIAPSGKAREPEPMSQPAAGDGNLPPVVSAAELRAAGQSLSALAPAPNHQPADVGDAPTVTGDAAPPSAAAVASPATLVPVPAASVPVLPAPEDRLAAITQQRDVLIAMLEEDIHHRKAAAGAATDLVLPRLEQQLRLLYAAADRPDDAARAVDSLNQAEREAYKHLMFGLAMWFGDEQPQRAPLRAARVLRSLRDASSELASASKLDLANLALCERVESFGWYTEFARYEFLPKQQVILYVEVENFVAHEKGPHSFETELQGSYQIFDARGNIVAERKLPLDREVCRNVRRDYFLAYPIYIPESIEPGRYRLELTIEDLKAGSQYQGRKFGEGTIEFTVRS
jgi:hypothetical protein